MLVPNVDVTYRMLKSFALVAHCAQKLFSFVIKRCMGVVFMYLVKTPVPKKSDVVEGNELFESKMYKQMRKQNKQSNKATDMITITAPELCHIIFP